MRILRNGLFVLMACAGAAPMCAIAAANDGSAARSDVRAGQKALTFRATTVDGKIVNFPGDYKGKVVLLDFWATWCPPCRAEIPKVVSVYNQFHGKGFEVVSVSLDHPKKGAEVLQFTKDNNMTWPQIYDGQYWKTAVAVQYGVHAIPCPVLVDGDTGLIIASDVGALGSRLTKAVQTRLAALGKAEPDTKTKP
jgi:thiol-disulfide isomerase/thioredoxin